MALYKHRVPNRWLIDSGATRHMTPDRKAFTKFARCGGEVEFGDQGVQKVRGRGNIEIEVGGHMQTMTDVLYVPGMSVNLLSIIALDRRGFTVFFGAQQVKIADSLTGKTIAQGRAVDGLYELTNSSSDRAFVSQVERLESSGSQSGALGSNGLQSNVGLSRNLEPQSRDQGSEPATPKVFELMHQRLGHPGMHRLKDLHLHADGVRDFEVPKDFQCDVCDQAKMVKAISRDPQTKTTVPGARLHSDYWGPYPTKSIIGGCIYYVFLLDEATGEAKLRPIASKAEVRPFLVHEIRSMIVQGRRLVVVVRLDNAKEYEAAKEPLRELGVELEFVSTYTAYQNGISERFNRTATTIARAMLIWSGLPLSFWAEAIIYACHIYNKLPHGARGSQSPDEMWDGRKPDLSKERVFGCVCRVYLAKEQRVSKLHPVNYLGIYTGYHSSTQYRVYRPDKNRFEWPTTVKFYEDRPGRELLRPEQLPKYDFLRAEVAPMEPPTTGPTDDAADGLNGLISSDDDDQDAARPPGGHAEPPQENNQNSVLDESSPEGEVSQSQDQTQVGPGEGPQSGPAGQQNEGNSPLPTNGGAGNSQQENLEILDPNAILAEHPPTTQGASTSTPRVTTGPGGPNKKAVTPTAASGRPARERRAPGRIQFLETYGKKQPRNGAHLAQDPTKTEPFTYEEAVNGRDKREWRLSILDEFEAHFANGTWELVHLPTGRKVITCKWVFKIKYNPDGTIHRYKSRVVARGFTQLESIDYHETFAPTLRFESLRLLFAIAGYLGLLVHQLDVDNAYLNSDLEEEVYMELPPGFPATRRTKGMVLRLRKGLYGLKQSARIWNQRFAMEVKKMGFKPISSDKCIFIRVVGGELAIIALYVDDILIFTKTEALMKRIKDQIKKAFKVKDSGAVKRILGIQVHRTKNGLFIEQSQYARKVLQEYGMDQCTPVATPMDGYESIQPGRPDEERTDQRAYQRRIGSLMYLMTGTRPDLAFAIGKLSQFCHDPTVRHANAVNRVLKYIAGTINYGIRFEIDDSTMAYSDAAYGDDKEDRKSTYGHVVLRGGGSCIWTSKKQRGVATSTTEAEYVGLTEAAKTVVWLTRWLNELAFRKPNDAPIQLLGDNKASLALVKNPEYHQRTKHIDIQYHYVRQVYEDGLIGLEFVPTASQAADILTKPLAPQAFERGRRLLGLCDLPSVQD